MSIRTSRNGISNGSSSSSNNNNKPTATGLLSYNRFYAASQIFARQSLQGWGRFVATRPIAVLLLCCVFLCTLTYPVLSLYAWAAPASASGFFSFLRTSPSLHLIGDDGSIARARDLKLPWQDLDSVVINGEEACWQRIPKFREVTVQQVLLGFPAHGQVASEHGVLDRKPLHGVHKLQERLHELLERPQNHSSLACVQYLDSTSPSKSRCFTLSPLSYWNGNENDMLSDTSLLATVNAAAQFNSSFPLRHDDLFVGRSYAGSTLRKADYGVLTLFLEGAAPPEIVSDMVQDIARDMGYVLVERARGGSKTVMKHRSEVRVRATLWEDFLFYTGYAIVGTYIFLTLRRLDKVHSRMGLVLTGIVQMLASGVMSLSLCALFGYKFNLVPVKLIPFLIVVLGVDNMFVLTTAVSNTSINLPVKERIAEGLAQSGVGIFLNLVMELGVCAGLYLFVQAEVIREMAVFSAVALIVDYVMEMTYFITVLSIDMHRLELADFLTQGSGVPTNGLKDESNGAGLPRYLEIFLNSVQDRQARTYTAVILIGSNYLLYLLYGQDYFVPAFCSNINHAEGPKLSPGGPLTASEAFWKLLGARPSEAIHVHIPSPVVLFFDSFNTSTNFYTFAKASIFAFIKFVVFPISLTTFGLYLLLAHLLKGTEHRHTGSGTISEDETYSAGDDPTREDLGLQPLCQYYDSADIELLAVSDDGLLCATWVPLERCIRLRSLQNNSLDKPSIELAIGKVLKPGESFTVLAVNDTGSHVAAATTSRRILIWQAVNGSTPTFVSAPNGKRITHIFTEPASDARHSPPPLVGQSSPSDGLSAAFLTAHDDGSILHWSSTGGQARTVIAAMSMGSGVLFNFCNSVAGLGLIIVRVAISDALCDAWRYNPSLAQWQFLALNRVGTSLGSVTALHVIHEAGSTYLSVGRSSGFVEVWHLEAEKQSFVSRLHEGSIRQVRLQAVPFMQCPLCRSPVTDTWAIVSSDASALFITRLHPPNADTCDCESGTSGQVAAAMGVSFPQTASPNRKAPSPRAASEDSTKNLAYPLSPHALRRLSHAADRKRPDDSMKRSDDGSNGSRSDLNGVASPGSRKVSSESRPPIVDEVIEDTAWTFVHLGSLALDVRDRWALGVSQVVGVRKRRQLPAHTSTTPLSRWEAWTCPLSTIKIHSNGSLVVYASALNTLLGHNTEHLERSQLPFGRIRQLQVNSTGHSVVSTFGNILCSFKIGSDGSSITRRTSVDHG